jgi:hypothetical protein
VTHSVPECLASLTGALEYKGRHDLRRLVGELRVGDKRDPELQAADMTLWHLRRWDEGRTANILEFRRLQSMLEGRLWTVSGLKRTEIQTLSSRLRARVQGLKPDRDDATSGELD